MMKVISVFMLLIIAKNINAQHDSSLVLETYSWTDQVSSIKFYLFKNGKFEFYMDYYFDCSPQYLIFGEGSYYHLDNSVSFDFDSIAHLKSTYILDSSISYDEMARIKIEVVDDDNNYLDNFILNWGKPKKRGKWTSTEFFSQKAKNKTTLNFTKTEKVTFIRIEKEGFYPVNINTSKSFKENYNVTVVLRPKPKIAAVEYISSGKWKLPIISNCEISFFTEKILKKESCP